MDSEMTRMLVFSFYLFIIKMFDYNNTEYKITNWTKFESYKRWHEVQGYNHSQVFNNNVIVEHSLWF